MKKKTSRLLIIIAVILILCIVACLIFIKIKQDNEAVVNAGTSDHAVRPATSLIFGDEEVPLKRNFSSLLVIGTDTIQGEEPADIDEFDTHNSALADFMTVLIFDDDNKTVTPLLLNRDTMCDVSWLSLNGKVAGYVNEQITFAHMYGSGGEDSAENCVNTVSNFLYKAPMDNYISFTMDAVPILNDLVGGVTVTLSEDIPALGDNYVKGANITLFGNDALAFVRYRDRSKLDSNVPRMERHTQYLNAFIPQARSAVENNQDFVVDAFNTLSPYLCTDMNVDLVSYYVNKLCTYEILPAVTYDGEYEYGQFAEYYPDTESLISCVKDSFCEE